MLPHLLFLLLLVLLSYALFVGLVLPLYAGIWREVVQILAQQKQAHRWKRVSKKM